MYRYKLKQGKPASYAALRKELLKARFTLMRSKTTGEIYAMPARASPIVQVLYRLVELAGRGS